MLAATLSSCSGGVLVAGEITHGCEMGRGYSHKYGDAERGGVVWSGGACQTRRPRHVLMGIQSPLEAVVLTDRSFFQLWPALSAPWNPPLAFPDTPPSPPHPLHPMAAPHVPSPSHPSQSSTSHGIVGSHYRVGKKIGEGSFGVVYEGLFPLSLLSPNIPSPSSLSFLLLTSYAIVLTLHRFQNLVRHPSCH